MKNRLFVTDLDGTLLRDDKTVSQKDLAAMERLKQYGFTRVLATGRSEYSFANLLQAPGFDGSGENPAGLPVDYVIFSTGAGIMEYPGLRVLQSKDLAGEDVVNIGTCFENMGLDYMVHRPFPDSKYFLYRSRGSENPDFQSRLGLYDNVCAPLDGRNSLASFGRATQLIAILPVSGNNGRTIEHIRRFLPGYSVITATSPLDRMSLWVEVFPAGVSKSSAAGFIADHLEIERADTVAVGNDYNDRDLLEWAGTGYVVENAPPDLRQIFETVPSNNRHGVSVAVSRSIP
ncbi:MAG: Cof-type HAD-IIB family hydrolase [Desulfarculaceae bacterium]|nr:Cof-type HAD-IIB family hydrolase [Desulfarculaceae bacterium]